MLPFVIRQSSMPRRLLIFCILVYSCTTTGEINHTMTNLLLSYPSKTSDTTTDIPSLPPVKLLQTLDAQLSLIIPSIIPPQLQSPSQPLQCVLDCEQLCMAWFPFQSLKCSNDCQLDCHAYEIPPSST
jgi:hypothetical protein